MHNKNGFSSGLLSWNIMAYLLIEGNLISCYLNSVSE